VRTKEETCLAGREDAGRARKKRDKQGRGRGGERGSGDLQALPAPYVRPREGVVVGGHDPAMGRIQTL